VYRSILIFLLLSHTYLYSQDSLTIPRQAVVDGVRILEDGERFFSASAHFSRDEWITAGALTGGTAILFSIDAPARTLLQRNHSHVADNLAEIGTYYGDAKYAIGFSGGLYFAGALCKNHDLRETGILIFESLGFAGLSTAVLKTVVGRSRPYLNEGSTRFKGFQLNNDHLSFPSGHSTVAFAISSVLAQRVGNVGASIGFYSLAVVTAASRIYNDEHWVSDTVLGAILGTVAGLAVTGYHETSENHTSIGITPTFNGIRATVSF
jgi:membrane-associated phospholipid phosphatase